MVGAPNDPPTREHHENLHTCSCSSVHGFGTAEMKPRHRCTSARRGAGKKKKTRHGCVRGMKGKRKGGGDLSKVGGDEALMA